MLVGSQPTLIARQTHQDQLTVAAQGMQRAHPTPRERWGVSWDSGRMPRELCRRGALVVGISAAAPW